MSFNTLLAHRATIKRRKPGKDRFGQLSNEWEPIATGVACRLTNARGGLTFTDRSQNVVQADYSIYFKADVDVGENNRIDVVDATGMVLASNLIPLLRRPVGTRDGKTHHISVPCQLFREAISAT